MASGAEEMVVDAVTSHMDIGLEDLSYVDFGEGSGADGKKPRLRELSASSPAGEFYNQVYCSADVPLPPYKDGDCPWCVVIGADRTLVGRKKIADGKEGRKIGKKRELGYFLAQAWPAHGDKGFVAQEFQRRYPGPFQSQQQQQSEETEAGNEEMMEGGVSYPPVPPNYMASSELPPFCGDRGCLGDAYSKWRGKNPSATKPRYWLEVEAGAKASEKMVVGDGGEEDEKEGEKKGEEVVEDEEGLFFRADQMRNNPHCSVCAKNIDRSANASLARLVPSKLQSSLPLMRSMWKRPNDGSTGDARKEYPDYLGDLSSICINGIRSMDVCYSCFTLLTKPLKLQKINPALSALLLAGEALQDYRHQCPQDST
jgi:hypothetical protein